MRVGITVTQKELVTSIATHGKRYLGTDIALNAGTGEKVGIAGENIK